MGNLGYVGAGGLAGMQEALHRRLVEQEMAKQRAFENDLALRTAGRQDRQLDQNDQLRQDALNEKIAAANEIEAAKAGNTLSIDQSIPSPMAATMGKTMQAANMRINPALSQPPNMPGMMQPDIVPGQQPGAVWTGSDAQRTTRQKQNYQADLINSLPSGSRERMALEYNRGTGGDNPPAGVFEPKPPTQVVQTIGPNGKPTFTNVADAPGKTPYHPPQPMQTVTIQTTDDNGNKVTRVVPKAQAVGKDFAAPDTAQTQTQKANASNVRAHIADISAQADAVDKMGLMGPVGGRWAEFLAGKIGSADLAATPQQQQLLDEFRANVGLLKSGMAMVHGGARGGGNAAIIARMDALINSDHMNLPLFKGSLKAFDKWLAQYEGKGGAAATGGGASTAEDLINKYRAKP